MNQLCYRCNLNPWPLDSLPSLFPNELQGRPIIPTNIRAIGTPRPFSKKLFLYIFRKHGNGRSSRFECIDIWSLDIWNGHLSISFTHCAVSCMTTRKNDLGHRCHLLKTPDIFVQCTTPHNFNPPILYFSFCSRCLSQTGSAFSFSTY